MAGAVIVWVPFCMLTLHHVIPSCSYASRRSYAVGQQLRTGRQCICGFATPPHCIRGSALNIAMDGWSWPLGMLQIRGLVNAI